MRISGRLIPLLLLIPAMAACRTNPLPLVTPGASESSTPSLLPSESATELHSLPDLVISLMYLEMEGRHGICVEVYTPYGIRVIVENIGSVSAGPFFVDLNGTLQEVKDGLMAGQHVELHFAGTVPSGHYVATADATDQIVESREDNNTLTFFAPTPTPPPLCTPAPTSTP